MSNDTLEVLSPYDEHLIEELPLDDIDEAERALATARTLADDYSKRLPIPQRIEILEKTMKLVEQRYDQIVRTAAEEGGKPLIDSRVEVTRAINGIKLAIESLSHMRGEEMPMNLNAASLNRMAFTFREPIGVVVAVSAFNHPFNLIVHQAIPAVAVGCPVIVKPASTTPLSCITLVDILYEAGLPKEWCRVINCDNEVAEKLVTDPRVDFMSFIGSSRVGWYLRSKLAPGTRCALEHGGAAPLIVEPDADLDYALPLISKGGFYHAGQVCVSVQRVYAHESISEELTSRLSQLAKDLVVGDPLDEKTEVGPLIHRREAQRVADWVDDAVNSGGTLSCGGKKIGETCYEPTVILNPSPDAKLSKLEIFGPVIAVYPYKDRRKAIRLANDVPHSFQASIFTKNIDAALDTVKRINASTVLINDHTAFRVDWMPFGGQKESGLGVGGIPYTMRDMTQEKLMIIKSDVL